MKKSKFTEVKKQEAVERYVLHSEKLAEIIKSIGISKSTFYVWMKEYQARQSKRVQAYSLVFKTVCSV